MLRLLRRGKINVLEIDESDAALFRTLGYFKKSPTLKTLTTSTATVNASVSPNPAEDVTTIISYNGIPENYNFNDPKDKTINYFYFGDLVYTIMDSMFLENSSKLRPEVENTKFLLGSFEFELYKKNGKGRSYNLAEIPISVDYFADWFSKNVIEQGDTRQTFPIITFIRNFSNNLLQASLLETCVNRQLDKRFHFYTTQITTYSPKTQGNDGPVDPLFEIDTSENLIIDVSQSSVFPLNGDSQSESRSNTTGNKVQNYFNYIYLGILGNSLTFTGKGNHELDSQRGVYHVDIGLDKGITKSINFAKTDMQFIREARFLNQGIDGLMQLSAVYRVAIKMVGNTIFYPGMELFLNPYGIGGPGFDPTIGPRSKSGRSIANKLGIGGYHTVIGVKSSIGVSGFETTIDAQMYYAGDGSTRVASKGKSANSGMQKIQNTNQQSTADKQTCEGFIKAIETDLGNLSRGSSTKNFINITAQQASSLGSSNNPPTQQVANAAGASNTSNLPTAGNNFVETAPTGAGVPEMGDFDGDGVPDSIQLPPSPSTTPSQAPTTPAQPASGSPQTPAPAPTVQVTPVDYGRPDYSDLKSILDANLNGPSFGFDATTQIFWVILTTTAQTLEGTKRFANTDLTFELERYLLEEGYTIDAPPTTWTDRNSNFTLNDAINPELLILGTKLEVSDEQI